MFIGQRWACCTAINALTRRAAETSLSGLGHLPSTRYNITPTSLPSWVRKLAGRDGWRLRVGHHRLLFEINDAERLVTILHIGHRKDVYRKP